jgi:hypothetical protein
MRNWNATFKYTHASTISMHIRLQHVFFSFLEKRNMQQWSQNLSIWYGDQKDIVRFHGMHAAQSFILRTKFTRYCALLYTLRTFCFFITPLSELIAYITAMFACVHVCDVRCMDYPEPSWSFRFAGWLRF